MSRRELERVEVMGRVAKEELKLMDAAAMLQLSYRQVKRLWRRYRQKGVKGCSMAMWVEFPIEANPRNFGAGC
jgi:hypothetical protein